MDFSHILTAASILAIQGAYIASIWQQSPNPRLLLALWAMEGISFVLLGLYSPADIERSVALPHPVAAVAAQGN